MLRQPIGSRNCPGWKKRTMDRLASTGADGGRGTTTGRKIEAGIHLSEYKSLDLAGQTREPMAEQRKSAKLFKSDKTLRSSAAVTLPKLQFPSSTLTAKRFGA